jgi:hypothetical protein
MLRTLMIQAAISIRLWQGLYLCRRRSLLEESALDMGAHTEGGTLQQVVGTRRTACGQQQV